MWLQDVVCTGDLASCCLAEETIIKKITNSTDDYIFADAGAADMLPEPPAQLSEAQLLELLQDIKGAYEAKPSRHGQGTSWLQFENQYHLSSVFALHQWTHTKSFDGSCCGMCRERRSGPVVTDVC